MAYNKLFFSLDRGNANTNNDSRNASIHTYINPADTLATILGGSYFPAYFEFTSDEVLAGDIFYVEGSDSTQIKRIVDPSVPTLSTVNYLLPYVFGSQTISFSGPWGSPISATVNYAVNSSTCTLIFPAVSGTAANWSNITASLGLATINPLSALTNEVILFNNVPSGSEHGEVEILTNGNITISPFTAGTGSATYGFQGFGLRYPVAIVGAQ